jgi:hypothetical protein
MVAALGGLGCRPQGASAHAPQSPPEIRESPCDDALGAEPLGAGTVSALVERLTFKTEDDRDQLASIVSLPAPLTSLRAAPSPDGGASVQEVKRQALPDGRCAAWLRTAVDPDAPATTTEGVLVVAVREGASVRVEAATRYVEDQGTLGFGRSRSYGVVTLYVARDDDVGTGAQERGTAECIWAVSKDRIDDALCYYTSHSYSPISGAGWTTNTTTTSAFAPNGVILRTHVEHVWSPPSEDQKHCRTAAHEPPDRSWFEPHQFAYDYQEPHALSGLTLTSLGVLPNIPRRDTESLVPTWVDEKADALGLPAVVEGDADLDCGIDAAE